MMMAPWSHKPFIKGPESTSPLEGCRASPIVTLQASTAGGTHDVSRRSSAQAPPSGLSKTSWNLQRHGVKTHQPDCPPLEQTTINKWRHTCRPRHSTPARAPTLGLWDQASWGPRALGWCLRRPGT